MGAAVAAIPFALPNRRVEAWKWSDLARAVEALALTPPPAAPHPTLHPILALAQFYGRNDSLSLAPGETLLRVERIDPQTGLTAQGFEALVARDAHLHRVVIQPFAADGVIALHGRIVLEAGARYTQTILAFGARFCRIETEIVHQGAGAQARLNAAYLVGEGAHVDLTSLAAHHIDHGVTLCRGRLMLRPQRPRACRRRTCSSSPACSVATSVMSWPLARRPLSTWMLRGGIRGPCLAACST